MRKLMTVIVVIVVILGLGILALKYWYEHGIKSANGDLKTTQVFEIKKGDSIDEIANNLEKVNLIKDKQLFIIYSKLNPELSKKFQAGLFEVSQSNSIKEMFVIFQKAKDKEEIKVTIPEGLRYDEIADILDREFKKQDAKDFDKSAFLSICTAPDSHTFNETVSKFLNDTKPHGKSLEGFLYPDTYLFSMKADAKSVIEKLISTLYLRISRDDMSTVEKSKYTFYEVLTIASIIERESLAVSEDKDIAGVLYKRLENGIDGLHFLEVDASLLYPVKDWKANVYPLKNSDSPYNTYKKEGIPPTPISNPGIDAILSSIYPKENPYYYYLHDKNGNIHFGKTYSEHLKNIKTYL